MNRKSLLNALIIFFIVLVVLFIRRSDAFDHPQLWAEDGNFFLVHYEQFGIKSFLMPASGYFHTIPRIISYFFGVLSVDLRYIPFWYNLSCFLITYFVALYLYKCAGILKIRHRIIYATSFLFLPLGSQIYLTENHIYWITTLCLINYIIVQYYSNKKYGFKDLPEIIILIILSFTGPCSLLLFPIIFIIFFLERKDWSFGKNLPMVVILFCGILQYITYRYVSLAERSFPGPTEKWHLLRIFTNNLNDILYFDRFLGNKLPDIILFGISLLICVFVFYKLGKMYLNIKFERKYVFLYTFIAYMASFIKWYWPNESRIIAMDIPRYHFIPYALMAWVFVIGMDKNDKLLKICISFYLVVLFSHYSRLKFFMEDIHWKRQVDEYYKGTRDTFEICPDGWRFAIPRRK